MEDQRPVHSRVTLEDLLELKRRERPPEAFWNAFDARLREKQLAALIPVGTPWSRWYAGFGRLAKFGLPIATVAAVAIAFVAVNRQSLQSTPGLSESSHVESETIASSDPSGTESIVSVRPDVDEGIRTVVIEAAPMVAEAAPSATMDADQIARTLPWLANVDFKREQGASGITLVEPLSVDRGPTPMVVAAFEGNKSGAQPAWAPTEQNIREAVATELGISTPVGDKSNRAWMTRLVANGNPVSKYADSRIESEYPRELTRVGLTGSTLSIKF